MPKTQEKRTTVVRQHRRRVPTTRKNPAGVTLVDRHERRLPGTYLDPDEIESIFKAHDRKGLIRPAAGKLSEYKPEKANKYDEVIAVWTDYFNRKFAASPPLDPDIVKALIASESSFRPDPNGEAKEFIFRSIRQKDLKDPNIAIPVAVRWLFRKQETAKSKLGRDPTAEELILDYKGLLKSKTDYKGDALNNFRKHYAELKKK